MRINISIEEGELARLDREAAKRGLSRSAFIRQMVSEVCGADIKRTPLAGVMLRNAERSAAWCAEQEDKASVELRRIMKEVATTLGQVRREL